MIFAWLKPKSREPTSAEVLARTFDMSLSDMLGMTMRMAQEHPADRAMVLIAFVNARSLLRASKQINKSDGAKLPANYADHGRMVAKLFDKYPSSQRGNHDFPDEAEIKFRRIFHFFRASVLGAASERAHQSNQEMAAVAEVWGEYIASAGRLTSIVQHTTIWTPDELAWFTGDFDEEAQIRNVLYSVVPGFLWAHDEMLDMAKRRFRVMTSFLKPYSSEPI